MVHTLSGYLQRDAIYNGAPIELKFTHFARGRSAMHKLMAMRELKRARTDAKTTGGSREIPACPQERGNCYVARGRTVHVTGKATGGLASCLVPDIRQKGSIPGIRDTFSMHYSYLCRADSHRSSLQGPSGLLR